MYIRNAEKLSYVPKKVHLVKNVLYIFKILLYSISASLTYFINNIATITTIILVSLLSQLNHNIHVEYPQPDKIIIFQID